MKILVISSLPFSVSNRGIDVITMALLEEGYDVHHLTFPYPIKNRKNVLEVSSDIPMPKIKISPLFPYYADFMHTLPYKIQKIFVNMSVKVVSDIEDYDVIIIESGKPVLLVEKIPDKTFLIYRQSDPVELLSKSTIMKEYEHKTIQRANLIITVRESIMQRFIPDIHKRKTVVIENGFSIPKYEDKNPYEPNTTNSIYVGYSPVDAEIIELLLRTSNLNIHLFGNCLTKSEIRKLSRYRGFFYYGPQPQSKIIPYVKYANFAIVPYDRKFLATSYIGVSSKFLLFMFFGLPIISSNVGHSDELSKLGVIVCQTPDEFIKAAKNVLENPTRIDYKIDFESFSLNGRKEVYKKLFRDIFSNFSVQK